MSDGSAEGGSRGAVDQSGGKCPQVRVRHGLISEILHCLALEAAARAAILVGGDPRYFAIEQNLLAVQTAWIALVQANSY